MVTARKIIDACVFKFLKKSFELKPVTLTVPKKQLFIVLPFMGNMSGVIKTGLSKALQAASNQLSYVQFIFFFFLYAFDSLVLCEVNSN